MDDLKRLGRRVRKMGSGRADPGDHEEGEHRARLTSSDLYSIVAAMASARQQIREIPWQLMDYMGFVDAGVAAGDSKRLNALFEERVLFRFSDEDVLETAEDLAIEAEGDELVVRGGGTEVRFEGDQRRLVEAVLQRVDGKRPAARIAGTTRSASEAWDVLDALTGCALRAPAVVAQLEARVPRFFITRVPRSPYGVMRSYWQNHGDVWQTRGRLRGELDDVSRFKNYLCEIHLTVHMGASLDSFYRPLSPIRGHQTRPGAFSPEAPWMGNIGPRSPYLMMIGARVGDGNVFADEMTVRDEDELAWVRLYAAQPDLGLNCASWPARPLTDAHFERLADYLKRSFAAADEGDRDEALDNLARFHQRFVQLHPFSSGNMSIAMSLVNQVLEATLGGGIPHVYLDVIGIVVEPSTYVKVFREAVDAYFTETGEIERRYDEVEVKLQRANELITKIQQAGSPAAAHALLDEDPETAALLMFPRR